MPHVIVKVATGKTAQQKERLAALLVKDVVEALGCGEEAVSLAIEEVEPQNWAAQVYEPDILRGPGTLYKKPGYTL